MKAGPTSIVGIVVMETALQSTAISTTTLQPGLSKKKDTGIVYIPFCATLVPKNKWVCPKSQKLESAQTAEELHDEGVWDLVLRVI